MKKLFTVVILPILIVLLAWLIYKGIQKPIQFDKLKVAREAVAVQKLKDIRTLQVAYKNKHGKFASSIDSLIDFYKNGKMVIVKQIGSVNDSAMVAHTEAVKKANRGINDKGLYELYLKGDKNLVFSIPSEIDIKDTLLKRENYSIDSLANIPFANGQKIGLQSVIKKVSGVDVPLFEATIPYKILLNGLDNQQIINLVAERETLGKYPGLKVGSIETPNNNAGNWE
ncbi:MAG: hypothetical protein IKI67_05895 [Bacteroidales bacterium]|nr:hypothetical protein [Bacteroidales bacterium]